MRSRCTPAAGVLPPAAERLPAIWRDENAIYVAKWPGGAVVRARAMDDLRRIAQARGLKLGKYLWVTTVGGAHG